MRISKIILIGVLYVVLGWCHHSSAAPEFALEKDSIEIHLNFLKRSGREISFPLEIATGRPKVGLVLSGGKDRKSVV